MNYYPFDSRNKLYKEKFGASAAGENLRLRLLLHADACVHNAFLRIRRDGEDIREIQLNACEWIEAYRFYDTEISLDEGLYWYDFRYTSDHGEFFVTKTETSLGIVSMCPGGAWQQTVYSADFETPDFLKGGIIYQIFPDRFYSSKQKKFSVPKDRIMVSDWEKTPEYRQNTGEGAELGNDYYGGDLKGIELKLPYLKKLGVTCIYLNPIFEAHSNHRYNTADYLKIDPLLGSEEDLISLCGKANNQGISVILDGVFSHTGDDSIYFNKYGRYQSPGAWGSETSPYRSWYCFCDNEIGYRAWWGVPSLPETNENDPSFAEFITGENGVLRHWLKCGISGWRLDVADELPDEFLCRIRNAVKAENPQAFILGEVWEDASNKISYGTRRKFLQGHQLDSVMNYPFANAILDFVRCGNAERLCETVLDIAEHYPVQSLHTLMNHIGTHDTARAVTALSDGYSANSGREWQSVQVQGREEYLKSKRRLKLAAVLQYTLPGVPSLFYGDEAGVEGYGDPFCRKTYPWGKEDTELLTFYRALGKIRRDGKAFKTGDFVPFVSDGDLFAFERISREGTAFAAVNRGESERVISLPQDYTAAKILGKPPADGKLTLGPFEYTVMTKDF